MSQVSHPSAGSEANLLPLIVEPEQLNAHLDDPQLLIIDVPINPDSYGEGHVPGAIFLDFRYRGVRCREQTALADTPQNRKKLEKLLKRIEAEIELGQFDYAAHFPHSKNASRFASPSQGIGQGEGESGEPATPRFADFAEEWFSVASVQWKASHQQTIRGILDRHLIPRFGETPVGEIEREEILRFRSELTKQPGKKDGTSLSAQRINHIMTALRMVLAEASERSAPRRREDSPDESDGSAGFRSAESAVDIEILTGGAE